MRAEVFLHLGDYRGGVILGVAGLQGGDDQAADGVGVLRVGGADFTVHMEESFEGEVWTLALVGIVR